MAQNNIIEDLIQSKAANIKAARDQKEQEKKEIVEKLLESLKTSLGDFWALLEGRGITYRVSWDHTFKDPDILIDIPALEDHRLAPISIKWDRNSHLGIHSEYYGARPFKVSGSTFPDIGAALLEARTRYPNYVENIRKERIDFYNKELVYQWRGKSEEELRALAAQLIAEFPEKEEEGKKALENSLRRMKEERDLEEAREEAEKAREAEAIRKQEILRDYLQKLAEWMKARDEIIASNEKIAEGIQIVENEEEYLEYKLTYALIATDEDELEKYVETREVYTLEDAPDSAGYWPIDGKRIKFFSPVSIEERAVKPSRGMLSKWVEKGGVKIAFAPTVSDNMIGLTMGALDDLPQEPELPEELRSQYQYYMSELYKKARALLEGRDPEDESDF